MDTLGIITTQLKQLLSVTVKERNRLKLVWKHCPIDDVGSRGELRQHQRNSRHSTPNQPAGRQAGLHGYFYNPFLLFVKQLVLAGSLNN